MLCYSPQSGSIALRREPYLWRRRDGSVQRVFDVFGGVLFVDQLGPFAHYGVERGLCLGMFSLLLPPVGYGYALFRLDAAKETLLLAAIGWLLVILGL